VNAVLTLDTVSLTWPSGTPALSNIDLTIAPGEFVAVVGPSGCGKSTLLRLAAGLQKPTMGTIHTGSAAVEFVFQDPTLLPWLDVFRNVALSLTLSGTEDSRRVEEALGEVGLAGDREKLPRQLSGGMKMRTSVARALVSEPDLFLLDEPFSAVDEMRREELNALLLALHAKRKFAAIFVTHSVSEAVLLADRILVMAGGPGRIHNEIMVPLDRGTRMASRFEAVFVELTRLVSESLKAAAA
jgi:NitT/TauT family transport system ATP-binding protein